MMRLMMILIHWLPLCMQIPAAASMMSVLQNTRFQLLILVVSVTSTVSPLYLLQLPHEVS